MKCVNFLVIVALNFFASPVDAQKGKGNEKGVRKPSAEQGNYRVAVVEIPEKVAVEFEKLKPRALLYRPIETSKKKLPLVVSLHGSGGGRRDIEQKKWQGAVRELLKPENLKYETMLLDPQSEGEWDPDSLQKMLDYVVRENTDVDPNRIYCMGYSMGGKGTWEWAMNYPDRFAAIIPQGLHSRPGQT